MLVLLTLLLECPCSSLRVYAPPIQTLPVSCDEPLPVGEDVGDRKLAAQRHRGCSLKIQRLNTIEVKARFYLGYQGFRFRLVKNQANVKLCAAKSPSLAFLSPPYDKET